MINSSTSPDSEPQLYYQLPAGGATERPDTDRAAALRGFRRAAGKTLIESQGLKVEGCLQGCLQSEAVSWPRERGVRGGEGEGKRRV